MVKKKLHKNAQRSLRMTSNVQAHRPYSSNFIDPTRRDTCLVWLNSVTKVEIIFH